MQKLDESTRRVQIAVFRSPCSDRRVQIADDARSDIAEQTKADGFG